MLRRLTKKRTLAALSVVAVLVGAGAAIAYFTSSGSGSGSANVGGTGAFTIASSPATGTMYPGNGTSSFSYTVTNSGSGTQNLASTSATVASSNSDITSSGVEVPGCLAVWFHANNIHPTYGELAHGASVGGSVDVTMDDANVIQDACQNKTPDISLSAS